MGYAEDVCARWEAIKPLRFLYESAWADCIALTLPGHEDYTPGGLTTGANQLARGPQSDKRGRRLYDSVGAIAVDRLAAGMESLVTPQSEKWHGLAVRDVFASAQTDEENEYFDRYRDYLFTVRYEPQAGYVTAHQRALRQCISLGTAVLWTEDCEGHDTLPAYRLPFRYRYMPVTRSWLDRNKYGVTDCIYFCEPVTARVAVQRYGEDKVSADIRAAFNDPSQKSKEFDILHAVFPREDRHRGAIGIRNSAFESAHIEVASKHLIRRSGFYEFPASVYHWSQTDGPYSESPVMFALAELKTLQSAGKSALRVAQNSAEPALAVAHDGVKVRINQNPRAVNYGMVNEKGQILVKPIVTGELTQAFIEFISGKREAVNDALYIRLFQIMVQNPNMTATEAMLRNNEKGELLGPAGSRIQEALSHQVDRETAILERKGVYQPGTPLTPPQSLAGRDFGPKMTSPLDRLRRMPEVVAMQQVIQIAAPFVEMGKPGILDNIDEDEVIRTAREVLGAPAKMMRQVQERDQMRAQAAQQQKAMQDAVQAEQEGKAGQAMGEGIDAMAGAGSRHGAGLLQAMRQSRGGNGANRGAPPA